MGDTAQTDAETMKTGTTEEAEMRIEIMIGDGATRDTGIALMTTVQRGDESDATVTTQTMSMIGTTQTRTGEWSQRKKARL